MRRLVRCWISIWLAVAGFASAGERATCEYVPTSDWMSEFQTVTVKDLTLAGSHDSGCVEDKYHKSSQKLTERSRKPKAGHAQSLNITGQLDAGIRMLDVRFGLNPFGSTYRLCHGEVNTHLTRYCYQTAEEYGLELGKWSAAHPTELVIVRVKFEGGDGSDKSKKRKALQNFRKAIDAGCATSTSTQTATAKVCGVVDASDPRLKKKKWFEYKVGELVSTFGSVVVLHYKLPHTKQNFMFSYKEFQQGRYSNSLQISEVIDGQHANFVSWNDAKGKTKPPTFGWWMTFTAPRKLGKMLRHLIKNGTYNVHANTPTLRGRPFFGWISELVARYIGDGTGMKGWTVWFDFAGEEQGDIGLALQYVNRVAHNKQGLSVQDVVDGIRHFYGIRPKSTEEKKLEGLLG